MKKVRSVSVATAAGSAGAKKLGQPVPDSNFGLGPEQLGAAAGTAVDAGPVLVPQLAGEGTLGAFLAEDAVLLGGQLGTPFGVGLGGGGAWAWYRSWRYLMPALLRDDDARSWSRIDLSLKVWQCASKGDVSHLGLP